MPRRMFMLTSLAAVLLAALTACQSKPPTPTPTPIPIMPGMMKLVDGCQPADLDNWTEQASYLAETFGLLMSQAADTPREDLTLLLEQMHVYKLGVDALIVPADCAQETHALITITIAEVMNTLEAYRNNAAVDIRPVITRAQATLQLVQTRISDLSAAMNATYQAQQE